MDKAKSRNCGWKGEDMNQIEIALIIMGKGMAGIFAVILVILALIWLIGSVGRKRNITKDRPEEQERIQGH